MANFHVRVRYELPFLLPITTLEREIKKEWGCNGGMACFNYCEGLDFRERKKLASVPQALWWDFVATVFLSSLSFLLFLWRPISCEKNEINNWGAIVDKMWQQQPHPSIHLYSYNFQRISEWKEMIKLRHPLSATFHGAMVKL